MASPTQLLSYLRIMSSISGKATPVEKKKGFHDVLLSRLENLKDVLSKNSQLLELQARLENQWKRADIPDQLRWAFVNTCLELMRELKQSLMAMKAKGKCDVAKDRVTEAAPLPADALSVGDQNTVLTTIQFIVTLGMCPNLLPGVGVPLQKRSEFAHVLSSCESIMSEKRLYDCLATLLDCIEHPQLGAIILSRHLPDILSGLLQISYAPLSSYSEHNKLNPTNCKESKNETKNNSEPNSIGQLSDQCWEVLSPGDMHKFAHNQVSCWQDRNQGVFITQPEREKCLFDLQRLLDRIYQPMVIRELLILQAGLGNVPQKRSGTAHSGKEHKLLPCTPKWLRDVCGLLLSERLMKPYGVKAVLLGVLEGSEDVSCSQDWKKCDTIAKLIANCPSQAQSVEEYYKHISPQILGLLRGPTAGLGRLLIRAASSVIREMFTQYPEVTQKYVMSLITGPLEKTTEDEGECAGTRIDESTIMQCVEDIHRVFVLGSHQTGLTIVWPVVHPIFELFCFCRKSVFHLRSYLRDILVDIIRRTDPQDAFKLLYSLAFKQMPSHTFGANTSTTNTTLNHSSKQLHGVTEMFPMKFMSDSFVISHGDDGGLTIKYHSNGGDKLDDSNNIMGNLKGDLLSNSEARALCMVELLNDVKKDNAAGDFFIYLMQELTCIVLDCSEDTNSDLFEYGEAVSSQHRLLVLNHVALMCEKLGPSILSSTSQVLAFIKSTFQRGCTIVNAHDQELGVAFITETLSLALGMLSAILGGAVKIEQDQQPLLQELLPLLGTLATAHPALEIQQMARDLRIVIATRGAVWSHKIKKRAENKRNMKDFQGDGEKDATNDVEGTRLAGCDFDEAFVQLCDPLVPVRGHAIMRVASLLRQRHPKAMESADTLLKIFLDQLTHDDSYIYLAAIQGLVSLADIRADTVVPQLAREFAQCRNQAGQISAEDTVAKLRGHYLPDDTTSSQRAERSPELRMKLGEALVKATRTCGDLLPQYKQQLLPALLSGVKDSEPLVRASSLSNLGDVCQLLRFSLGPVLNEIFSSVTAVLKTDESAEVRRAAVLVITLLLRGLGKSAFEVVDTYLKQMYQLLKFVESTDPDVLTRAHAQAALGELDTITREYLFPKPSFTKHIQVLP